MLLRPRALKLSASRVLDKQKKSSASRLSSQAPPNSGEALRHLPGSTRAAIGAFVVEVVGSEVTRSTVGAFLSCDTRAAFGMAFFGTTMASDDVWA